jgi:predicted negative regulator of RcsB-dependent stress response
MKQNTLIIVVVLVAIGAIGWMIYRQQQARANAPQSGTNINATLSFGGTQPPAGTPTVRNDKRVVMV